MSSSVESIIITTDTREHNHTITEFSKKLPSHIGVRVDKLDTFDIATDLIGIELKSVDDFIGAVIDISDRKDGSKYERMKEQFKRMCRDKRPVKILLIHGDLNDAHSNLHPHSYNGMIASYTTRGLKASPPVLVQLITEDMDWIDYSIRLVDKTHKYMEKLLEE